MPEDNFEQQARHMAERFNMQPNPEVWLTVQTAIAPKKRRRRALIWWWLLPLCMAGGIAIHFMNHHKILSSDKDNMALTKTKNKTKKEENSFVGEKENHQAVVNSDHRLPEPSRKENKERRNTPDLFEKNKEEYEVIRQQNEVANNEYQEIKKDDKEKQIAKFSGQKEKVVINPDSISEASSALHSNEVVLPDDIIKIDTIAIAVIKDSLLRKRDTAIAIDKKIENKKKNNNKTWQFGILAEIGVASRGKSLFNFSKDESKSLDSAPTTPQNNSGGLNSGNDSSGSSVLVYQTIKYGIDAGVGITMRKTLPHHLYISGQFSYRYQQYTVRNIVRDSVLVNGTFSGEFSNSSASDENYHLHFLNLFTGIGWQYFSGKKSTLSVETGIDNSLLITMKHRKQDQSSQFNNAANNSFDLGDFYRWQPHATIALPVAFYTSNTHLQLSPFAHFGLHLLQKNNDSYKDNHLASAGVQAIYFFK